MMAGIKSTTILRNMSLVVFLGWLMVWILLPTERYKYTWSPKLNKKLNSSTYFRSQGTNLLLFTFPIMFIAALGSVYLHFEKKKSAAAQNYPKSDKKKISHGFVNQVRRPALIMSPLGIVSAIELTFAVMFVVLMIWSFSNYLQANFSHLTVKKGQTVWQAKLKSVALRFGLIGNTCLAFLFFPVTRGSSILPLFGLISESAIKYHIWLGHLSNFLFMLHAGGYIAYWVITHQSIEMLEWSKTGVSNVAGEIAIVFLLAIWVTSFRPIRRKMFEVFYYTHHSYVLFILFYCLHVGPTYICMVLPGIFLFLIDRYLRFLQSHQRARLVSVRLLPCDATELTFSKSPGLNYNPTSMMFINVPSISKLQWHPFTTTTSSNMNPDTLSVVIKTEGSWSRKLYQLLSSSSLGHLRVSVEGPYGPTSPHFLRRESLVMVCGGSGITPFISIIREVIAQSTKQNSQVPLIHLICAFKHSIELTMLDLLLPISSTPIDLSKIQLQIEAYVTREKEQPHQNSQKLINIVRFKSDPSDSPISLALGENNWLWLGAIIASSCGMFLLFLALVNRYYIYPIENNTKAVYHNSYKVIWILFLACACICIASSVGFYWCKKIHGRNEKKLTQITSLQTPQASPSLWFHNDDKELESLPQESITEATKVYYGCRPDLKKILLECKGNDIGVLVCGPNKMRHEVAKMCSSRSASNLHFESMSFSW